MKNQDIAAELKGLKKELISLEDTFTNEKECLLAVINTFSTLLDGHPEFSKECAVIKDMLKVESNLPVGKIQNEVGKLRKNIFELETKSETDVVEAEEIRESGINLIKTCKMIKSIIEPFLDDFYPLSGRAGELAASINLDCTTELVENDLEKRQEAFHRFAQALKKNIKDDMNIIKSTFLVLLEQVNDIESVLSRDLGKDARLKEFEHFENRVENEVGFIISSFDVHKSVDAIKNSVINKLDNIRKLFQRKKDEEVKQAQKAEQNIAELKKKIVKAEKDIHKMTEKAEHFKKSAEKDGLTGLFNRSSFDEYLADAIEEYRDTGKSLMLILFDIDKFKEVNDNYGHAAGDKVLRVFARCLNETFREDDFIARYGGDEFAVIIKGASRRIAKKRVSIFDEKLDKAPFVIRKIKNNVKIGKKRVKISASSGIAEADSGDTQGDLIRKADEAMYSNKQKRHQAAKKG